MSADGKKFKQLRLHQWLTLIWKHPWRLGQTSRPARARKICQGPGWLMAEIDPFYTVMYDYPSVSR